MTNENLKHFEPSEESYRKFEEINALTEEDWGRECASCNDCSICRMAIRQELYSTTKHTCVYGMSKGKFEAHMDNADVYF